MGIVIDKRPFLIAGPCSAESEEQVLSVAHQIKKLSQVNLFRAGIWKARTNPDSFEGVGVVGLKWLQRVKEELNIPVIVEVATVEHIRQCLEHGIDVFWIGARTTVNPFAIQSIADFVGNMPITLWVKNPVNPDINVWIGAFRRLQKAGIDRLGAIHRGFSSFEQTLYRNRPDWIIPIELRRQLPDIPILCDPSHITGNRELICEIAQKALDLDFDGLMIETHCNPNKALSDAPQQILPQELQQLLETLTIRNVASSDNHYLDKVAELRKEIDILDNTLLDILERRMAISDCIGKWKRQHDITVLQQNRWNEILTDSLHKGSQKGLSKELIETIFNAIHRESINRQLNNNQ